MTGNMMNWHVVCSMFNSVADLQYVSEDPGLAAEVAKTADTFGLDLPPASLLTVSAGPDILAER